MAKRGKQVGTVKASENPRLLDVRRMKAQRERLGLTQEQAAQAAGLSGRQGWNALEREREGNITLELLGRLARALKLPPRELIRRK